MALLDAFNNAIEAVRHRLRGAQRTEGNSITVTARVVSPPIPFNTRDADLLYGDPELNREREASRQRRGLTDTPSRMAAFVFRGYIVDKDWPQNPHKLLQNPCAMSTAGIASIAEIEDAIKLCTKFVSEESYSGQMPKMGDWVRVRLSKIRQPGNNEGSWNTAMGDFVSMAESEEIPEETTTPSDPQCISLLNQFSNQSSVGSAADGVTGIPAGSGSVEITPDVPPIVQACMAKGYSMYTDGKLNLIGVRAQETVSSDLFVDTMYISWKAGEGWETRSYPITTKPGKYVLQNPIHPKNGSPKRTAILKPGQYSSWQIWDHNGHIALGQVAAPVTIYLDGNKDAEVNAEQHSSPASIDTGHFSINIHRSLSSGPASTLTYNKRGGGYGSWSEGCQVFQSPSQFEEFMGIIISKRTEMPSCPGWTNLTDGYKFPRSCPDGECTGGNFPTFTYTLINYLDFDVEGNTYPGYDLIHDPDEAADTPTE